VRNILLQIPELSEQFLALITQIECNILKTNEIPSPGITLPPLLRRRLRLDVQRSLVGVRR
jgi:hypothetical protein